MRVFQALNGWFVGLNFENPIRLDQVGQTFFWTLGDLDAALKVHGLRRSRKNKWVIELEEISK